MEREREQKKIGKEGGGQRKRKKSLESKKKIQTGIGNVLLKMRREKNQNAQCRASVKTHF